MRVVREETQRLRPKHQTQSALMMWHDNCPPKVHLLGAIDNNTMLTFDRKALRSPGQRGCLGPGGSFSVQHHAHWAREQGALNKEARHSYKRLRKEEKKTLSLSQGRKEMSGTCSHWGNGKSYHILKGLDNLWDFKWAKCIIPGQNVKSSL